MQNWTTINEIPADVSRFISVEREDDKITSLVLSLPDCKPLRVIGHDYSKAIKLTGPTPPKDIEIFVIRRPDGDLAFYSERRAEKLVEQIGLSVERHEVSEEKLAEYAIADRGADREDANDLPF